MPEYTLRYEGSEAFASLLAHHLAGAGFEVEMRGRGTESRGLEDLASNLGVAMFVYVLTRPKGEVPAAVDRAIELFRRSTGGRARIVLEQDGQPLKIWTADRPPQ